MENTPAEVIVANADPVPVTMVGKGPTGLKVQDQSLDPSIPAKTTYQQDLTTAGQRQINLIWERTQAVIAVSVVAISLIAAVVAMIYGKEVSAFLSFICGNIIGFYFSRTNHAAIGGVGPKAQQSYYEGR
jgi:hypothetical protein